MRTIFDDSITYIHEIDSTSSPEKSGNEIETPAELNQQSLITTPQIELSGGDFQFRESLMNSPDLRKNYESRRMDVSLLNSPERTPVDSSEPKITFYQKLSFSEEVKQA